LESQWDQRGCWSVWRWVRRVSELLWQWALVKGLAWREIEIIDAGE